MNQFGLPEAVAARARALGESGERWLAGLDDMIAALEAEWHVAVGSAMSGGTHAFVGPAEGADGGKYILKIDVPDISENTYMNEVRTLQIAGGEGYARVHRVDARRRAMLMERLGPRLSTLGLPVNEQIEIICGALKRSWRMPADGAGLSNGADSIGWFRSFIPEAWRQTGMPCSEAVIDRAMEWLDDRERSLDPSRWVLVHGDAHNNNTLQCLDDPAQFKLIDPDGVFCEPEYDLGVLMREWPDEYREDPVGKGLERAALLSRLTGAEARGIWAWGYLQTVSTSLVLIQLGQTDLAARMLAVAGALRERR